MIHLFFWLFMLVCSAVMVYSSYMLVRSNAVYKERSRWLNEHPFPEPGDPDFWLKLRIAGSGIDLCQAISYSEMYRKFWIPVPRWKAIAQRRLEIKKAMEGKGGSC